jgi:uncharacterized protein with NRDE domain
MCLLVVSIGEHPQYPFILAHNRDEYYERPTEGLSFWEKHPDLLAGRDVRCGGTWLGLTRQGRFGTVTNYRDPAGRREHGLSRGLMLLEYLTGDQEPDDFLADIAGKADDYAGFNLLIGSVNELYYYSNMGPPPVKLSSGTYSLSNHLLDTSWPKVTRARKMFDDLLHSQDLSDPGALFHLLADRTQAGDDELPDSGVGYHMEKLLSPIFITSDIYGTRASTVITVDRQGNAAFHEKDFASADDPGILTSHALVLK